MTRPVLELDGARFRTLDEFYDEVSAKLVTADWGRNLDAFNDILRGGFGTPPGGFVLRWKDAARSRSALGRAETVRYLEGKLARCHPSNRRHVQAELEDMKRGRGETVFELLVAIIRRHGPGGDEAGDGVELELA